MADADKKPAVLGATAFKPVERKGWEAVRYLIHDPDKGEYFTRTPKSWALITGFYIVYYSCLAAFWAAMLMIFFTTLKDGEPKWIGAESLIGVSPGVGLNPKQLPELIDSSMIQFNKDSETDTEGPNGKVAGWGGWAERSNDYLASIKTGGKACSKDNPASDSEACEFKKTVLSNCNIDGAGFKEGKPCLFLKLNKIFGVENKHYDGTTKYEFDDGSESEFPKDMPESLKTHIKDQLNKEQVWVDCKGEYPADVEGLGAPRYFPDSRGFPGYFFPYKKQENYQSPIVAVQFPDAKVNRLLHVECRVWAKNIGYNRRDRVGINHFELMILDNDAANEIVNGGDGKND